MALRGRKGVQATAYHCFKFTWLLRDPEWSETEKIVKKEGLNLAQHCGFQNQGFVPDSDHLLGYERWLLACECMPEAKEMSLNLPLIRESRRTLWSHANPWLYSFCATCKAEQKQGGMCCMRRDKAGQEQCSWLKLSTALLPILIVLEHCAP